MCHTGWHELRDFCRNLLEGQQPAGVDAAAKVDDRVIEIQKDGRGQALRFHYPILAAVRSCDTGIDLRWTSGRVQGTCGLEATGARPPLDAL